MSSAIDIVFLHSSLVLWRRGAGRVTAAADQRLDGRRICLIFSIVPPREYSGRWSMSVCLVMSALGAAIAVAVAVAVVVAVGAEIGTGVVVVMLKEALIDWAHFAVE